MTVHTLPGSMYGLTQGTNVLAPLLFPLLAIDRSKLGRLRDCYLGRAPEGELEIHVLTRNGAGNREHCGEGEAGPSCGCTGCVMALVPSLPGYIRDFDDSFDATYATIAFAVPEELRPRFEELVKCLPDIIPGPLKDRFEHFFRMMQNNPNDPEVRRATEAIRPIIEQLK